jgi:hypothetical protein
MGPREIHAAVSLSELTLWEMNVSELIQQKWRLVA